MTETVYNLYLKRVDALLARIGKEEEGSILRAGSAVADRIAADRLIYVIGSGGHSQIGAEEVFSRAGGLACISAFLDDGLYLGHGAVRSMRIERTPGYARAILGTAKLDSQDILIIVNAYGINSATIDSALYARELGVFTIGVTSVEHQTSLPLDHDSRHPSKQNLCDLVDIVVDTKVPIGDALMSIDGVREKVGPVSTFANAFAMNSIMLEAVAELARRGIEPPVWRSSNSPGGEEANAAARTRYGHRIRNL